MKKINVNITKAKITQISIDFSEKEDPEIYANLALYTENNKIKLQETWDKNPTCPLCGKDKK